MERCTQYFLNKDYANQDPNQQDLGAIRYLLRLVRLVRVADFLNQLK